MKQDHGVPALLSFFFPGLGQLVKGQWERAVVVWGLIFGPWFVLGVVATKRASGYSQPPGPEEIVWTMLQSPLLPFVLFPMLFVWLWSVVDAYNRPI